MTQKRLNQYRALKYEISVLQDVIDELESKPNTVSDTVQSAAEFPYSLHTVTISGLPIDKQQGIIERKTALEQLKAKAEKELQYITEWIATIEDSDIRGIIVMRYVQGKSWIAIAMKYRYSGEASVRTKIKRFLEKN